MEPIIKWPVTEVSPEEVFKVMRRRFPNVDYRLSDNRPWNKVPEGYVVDEKTRRTITEDNPIVTIVWKGTSNKKHLKSAGEYLVSMGYRVEVEPSTQLAGRTRSPMCLRVFR